MLKVKRDLVMIPRMLFDDFLRLLIAVQIKTTI